MFCKQHFRTLSRAGSRTSFMNDDGPESPHAHRPWSVHEGAAAPAGGRRVRCGPPRPLGPTGRAAHTCSLGFHDSAWAIEAFRSESPVETKASARLRPRLRLGGLLDAYAGPRPCGPCFGVGRWLGGSEHLTGVPTAPRPVPLHGTDARFVVKASKRASHVKSLWLLVPEPQLIWLGRTTLSWSRDSQERIRRSPLINFKSKDFNCFCKFPFWNKII